MTSDTESVVKETNNKIQLNSMGIFINVQAEQHMCILQSQGKDTNKTQKQYKYRNT